MERIAIISDIHGNLEALKAVLGDIENRNIDKIYCIGDIIHKGVHSKECLELVRQKCDIVLQGNCDDYFSKEHDLNKIDSETEKMRIKWTSNILSNDEKEYLQNLPLCYEFYLSGSLVRLFHATPYNCYDKIGAFADINRKREMFLPTEKTPSNNEADVIVYGHIHMQLLLREYNKTIINCGSVGNPLDYIRNDAKDGKVEETIRAEYLILEGEYGDTSYAKPINIELIKVPYDIDKELSSDLFNPEKEMYEIELRKGRYRDLEKVYKYLEKDGLDTSQI